MLEKAMWMHWHSATKFCIYFFLFLKRITYLDFFFLMCVCVPSLVNAVLICSNVISEGEEINVA